MKAALEISSARSVDLSVTYTPLEARQLVKLILRAQPALHTTIVRHHTDESLSKFESDDSVEL